MTEETRQRALKALSLARNAGGDNYLFPRVFVCGTHVFFTFMAAYRQQLEYKLIEGKDEPIEKVDTPFTTAVNWNENQRGEIGHGEVFPIREYSRLINS